MLTEALGTDSGSCGSPRNRSAPRRPSGWRLRSATGSSGRPIRLDLFGRHASACQASGAHSWALAIHRRPRQVSAGFGTGQSPRREEFLRPLARTPAAVNPGKFVRRGGSRLTKGELRSPDKLKHVPRGSGARHCSKFCWLPSRPSGPKPAPRYRCGLRIASQSAATISLTRAWNLMAGDQPSFSRALE